MTIRRLTTPCVTRSQLHSREALALLLPLLALGACAPAVGSLAPHGADSGGSDDVQGPLGGGGEDRLGITFSDAMPLDRVAELHAIAVADLDGDGRPDLVSSGDDGLLVTRFSDGAGGFRDPREDGFGLAAGELVARAQEALWGDDGSVSEVRFEQLIPSDLDGDWDDDLVVSASLWRSDGSFGGFVGVIRPGIFGMVDVELLMARSGRVIAEPVADLDGDGLKEVVVHSDATLRIAWGAEASQLTTLGEEPSGGVYPQAWTMDINQDGRRDLVTAHNGGFGVSDVSACLGTGAGLGSPQTVTGDLFALQVWADVPPGEFASELIFAMPAEPAGLRRLSAAPEPVLSAQMDSDIGVDYLIHGFFGESGRSMALAPSAGSAVAVQSDGADRLEVVPLQAPTLAGDIFTGDLDGDGRDDLIQARWENDGMVVEWLRNISG